MTQILNRPSERLTCLLAKGRCVHQRDDGESLTRGRNNFYSRGLTGGAKLAFLLVQKKKKAFCHIL